MYIPLAIFTNMLIIAMFSICFGAWAYLLIKHYKKYIIMRNLSSYWMKVTWEVVDIVKSWEKVWKMAWRILKVKYKENILESENIFSDRIYFIKKWENIDILVDDLDIPKNYIILREA